MNLHLCVCACVRAGIGVGCVRALGWGGGGNGVMNALWHFAGLLPFSFLPPPPGVCTSGHCPDTLGHWQATFCRAAVFAVPYSIGPSGGGTK
jgi:hypothetical protein